MARLLHKKKGKELYAIYSTVIDDYITEFVPLEKIKRIWLSDLILESIEKVERYLQEVDEEVE